MKRFLKAVSLLTVLSVLICLVCTGCTESDKTPKNNTTTTSEQSVETPTAPERMKIGIIQYSPYYTLEKCCDGIKMALDEARIDYDYRIGSAQSPLEDCKKYVSDMISSDEYDLIIAISTPAAATAFNEVKKSRDIPVVFCAVSDPVSSDLVQSLQEPKNNCTGTSDVLDFEGQLNLITTFQPYLSRLGVLYTSTEPNSVSQLELLKAEASKVGIEIVEQSVADPTELSTAAYNLSSQVGAITMLTDNDIAINIDVVLEQARAWGIPVYGCDREQMTKGCLGGMVIDYLTLGKQTGEMAVSVINGANPAKIPVTVVSESTVVINSDMLSAFVLTLPDEYKTAEIVKTITDK